MFDVEAAKAQVDAVPKLALPYFLDACDEIERLREAGDALDSAADDYLASRRTDAAKRLLAALAAWKEER